MFNKLKEKGMWATEVLSKVILVLGVTALFMSFMWIFISGLSITFFGLEAYSPQYYKKVLIEDVCIPQWRADMINIDMEDYQKRLEYCENKLEECQYE